MKKILSGILAVCLIIPFAFLFAGCGGKPKAVSSVTTSINPEVTFILDSKDKVITVEYSNNDASTIFANVNFNGLNIDDAVEQFVERCTISGYVSYNGEEVEIDVNGSNDTKITELQTKVKTQVEDVFSKLGVQVDAKIEQLSENERLQELKNQVAKLAPEKSLKEINDMTREQLMQAVNEKTSQLQGLAHEQVEVIEQLFGKAQNAILKLIETARQSIETIQNTINTSQFLSQEVKNQLLNDIKEYEKEIDEHIKEFLKQKDEKIKQLKEEYKQLKNTLITNYKNLVASHENSLIQHLDAKLAQGTITQAQYDYWKNLINSNK